MPSVSNAVGLQYAVKKETLLVGQNV